jgi:hypothetical protein
MQSTKRAVAIFLEVIDRQLEALIKLNSRKLFADEYDDKQVEAALQDEQVKKEIEK